VIRWLVMTVLDFLNDVRPINLVGHRFSGSKPPQQGTLHSDHGLVCGVRMTGPMCAIQAGHKAC